MYHFLLNICVKSEFKSMIEISAPSIYTWQLRLHAAENHDKYCNFLLISNIECSCYCRDKHVKITNTLVKLRFALTE